MIAPRASGLASCLLEILNRLPQPKIGNLHLTAALDRGVIQLAQACQWSGMQPIKAAHGVDVIVVNVDTDDLGNHQMRMRLRGVSRKLDRLAYLAFEMSRRVSHTARLSLFTWQTSDSDSLKFVNAVSKLLCAGADLLALRPGGHAPDKLPSVQNVAIGVLQGSVCSVVFRHHDPRRVTGDILELTVRRELVSALFARRRNPTGRPGDHAGLERAVRKIERCATRLGYGAFRTLQRTWR